MKKHFSFSLFFILLFTSLFALDTTDRNAIDKVVEHFTHAWNDCEGRGSGDYYAEDADFVNIFGTAFSGKQEIETRHVKIHETFLKGSMFEVMETRVREAKPEVVIAQVYWKVTNIQKPGAETMKGIFTHTFVKNNGAWEITSTQNTLISP
ncbi:MAG: YybH family protein [Chlamydiales bacterium]